MKKYAIAIAVFLLTAAMANAQTTKKTSTSIPTVKTSHSTSAKKSTSSTASVTPSTSATENKTTSPAQEKESTIKRLNPCLPGVTDSSLWLVVSATMASKKNCDRKWR